jgi:hypothetical protein
MVSIAVLLAAMTIAGTMSPLLRQEEHALEVNVNKAIKKALPKSSRMGHRTRCLRC